MGVLLFVWIFLKIVVVLVIIVVILSIIDHVFYVSPRVKRAKEHIPSASDARGFSTKKLPTKIDAIVIGSGIGGLSTACHLARRGKCVVVLEQHDKLGGCTHTFEEKGFEFDTGLHYVGGEVGDKKSMLGFIFHMLSVGILSWSPLQKCYDIAMISNKLEEQDENDRIAAIPIPDALRRINFESDAKSGNEAMIRTLSELFPKEKKGIHDFYRLVHWANMCGGLFVVLKLLPIRLANVIRKAVGWFMLDPFFRMTTREVINSCVSDEHLRGILAWCWGDYGTSPGQSPFFMHAELVHHFAKGAFYPTGGASQIPETFLRTIEANGGRLFVRAPVKRILLSADGTSVKGVVVEKMGEENEIYAPLVISGAGLFNTYDRLIPHDVQCPVAERARACFDYKSVPQQWLQSRKEGQDADYLPRNDKLEPSCAMVTVFVGLEGDSEELGLPSGNYWLYPNWDHDRNTAKYLASVALHDELNCDKMYLPVVFMGSGSAKDSSWRSRFPGKSVLEMVTVADHEMFSAAVKQSARSHTPTNRGKNYDDAKKILQDRLLEVMYDVLPQVRGKVRHVDIGTPVTNNYYLGTAHGEVYGLSHTLSRFTTRYDWLQRPTQPIRGLYLTGQDVFSDGICGALGGGLVCAIAVDWTVIIDIATSYLMEM